MSIQRSPVVVEVGIDYGKVEIDDQILIAVGRRILSNIQVAIELLESVSSVDVIVMAQHGQGEALAKSARADKQEVFVSLHHFLYKPCLVDIITIVLADIHEVHHAVRYALCFYLCCLAFHSRC